MRIIINASHIFNKRNANTSKHLDVQKLQKTSGLLLAQPEPGCELADIKLYNKMYSGLCVMPSYRHL
jgi:hypothetical protein